MKTIMVFKLPEDRNELLLAQRGSELYSAAWDFSQHLRNLYKYQCDTLTEDQLKLVEELREKFYNLFGELLDGVE